MNVGGEIIICSVFAAHGFWGLELKSKFWMRGVIGGLTALKAIVFLVFVLVGSSAFSYEYITSPAQISSSSVKLTIRWGTFETLTGLSESKNGQFTRNISAVYGQNPTVSGLTEGVYRYDIGVRLPDEYGESWTGSDSTSVEVLFNPVNPGSVTLNKAQAELGDILSISWSDVSAAHFYEIDQSVNSVTWENIATVSDTSPHSHTFPLLYSGDVKYRVRACKNSAYSTKFGCSSGKESATIEVSSGVEFDVDSHGYAVFSGDFNSDGYTDYYFYSRERVLILHGEIATPIMLPPNSTFSIYGSEIASWSPWAHSSPKAESLPDYVVQGLTRLKEGVDYFIGDFDGDGKIDFLFRGQSSQEVPFIVQGVNQFTLPKATKDFQAGSELAALINNRSKSFYIADKNGDGVHDIVLRSGNSFVADTAFLSVNGLPETKVELTEPDTKYANLAGTMDGEAGVSASGAATYVIPIKLPQGSGGHMPQLALNYSSQGGNGLMGLGWGISGLSVIKKCFRTLAQDNLTAVNGAKDRFCMDGQRLVVDSGFAYGDAGATYKTEVDSFRKITAVGSDGRTPDHFMVKSKDGKSAKYVLKGNESYLLTEVTDSSGKNFIRYSYLENDGKGYRIEKIEYAYGTGSSANAHIKFVYEGRPDVIPANLVAGENDIKQRVARIEVFNNDNEFRTYHLNYLKRPASAIGVPFSRISSIQECVGSSCLLPATFQWNISGQPGFNSVAYCGDECNLVSNGTHFRPYGRRVADVNGDGRADYVWLYKTSGGSTFFRVSLSDGQKWVNQPYSVRAYSDARSSWHLADYNGDGQLDVIYATDTGWSVSLFNGQDFTGGTNNLSITSDNSKQSIFQDVSGDGLPDLIVKTISKKGLNIYYAKAKTSGGFEFSGPADRTPEFSLGTKIACNNVLTEAEQEVGDLRAFRLQDKNGDGAVEFIYPVYAECPDGSKREMSWSVHHSSLNNLSTGGIYLGYQLDTSSDNDKFDFKPADLNKDGKSDLIFKDHENNWSYFIRDVGSESNRIALPDITGEEVDLVDFNFDGYLDLAWPSNGKLNVKIWNGNGFASPIVTALDSDAGEKHIREYADVDGDGYHEFIRIYDGESEFHMLYNSPLSSDIANNVIRSVTNGYGKESSFTYKPLTDSTAYTKGQGAPGLNWGQPVFDITGSVYVVSKHEYSMPTTASSANKEFASYKYKRLRVQGGGRGNLGFEEVTKADSRAGSTKTVFAQQFPYTGMPLAIEKRTPQGKLQYKLTNTLAKRASSWPYVDFSKEQHYLLKDNGASAGPLYKIVDTDNTYDDFGNLELSITTTKSASGQTVSKVTQDNCFTCFSAPSWYREYGRVASTKITTVRGTVSESREVRFKYYGNGSLDGSNPLDGLLEYEQIEPNYTGIDKDQVKLKTTYTYDNYANRLTTTKSATGEVSRSSQSVYDPQKRYIDKTIDADGRTLMEVMTRNSLGQPTEIRTYLNVSGTSYVTTSIQYDTLGREIFREETGAPWVKTEYKRCTSCSLSGAVNYTVVTSETGDKVTTYYDKLGRKLREESLGFKSSDVNLVDTEYDELGRVKRQSEPYPNGGVAQYWTTNNYDINSRVTSVTLPDTNTITYPEPLLESNLIVSTTVNPKGQKRTDKKNVLGETVFVLDHHDGQVEFQYDPLGNVEKTISHGRLGENLNIAISVTYDKRGRKATLTDPDKGYWTYTYNAFGELTEQVNGKQQKVVTEYDHYGRPLHRTDYLASGTPEGYTRWYYDDKDAGGVSKPYALGKVTSVIMSEKPTDEICFAGTTHYCGFYDYDSSGKQTGALTILGIGGADGSFYSETAYDSLGRPQIQYDVLNGVVKDGASSIASGIQEHYTGTGHLDYVTDLGTGRELYRVIDTNSRGQVTDFDINSGKVRVDHNYDPATGRLLSQKADKATSGTVQQMAYTWDAIGNITSRHNQRAGSDKKESFCYDHLNRLLQVNAGTVSTASCNPVATNTQYRYDSIGNITSKDGAAYLYQSSKPHAVTKVGTVSYTYADNNGNLTSDGTGRSFTYSSFDKPTLITNSISNDSTAFTYGPDRSRYKRVDTRSNNEVITTHYLGNVERIHRSSDGKYRWKRYLPGGAVFTYTTDATFQQQALTEQYLLKDHIGSTDVVLDANGNIADSMAFDPWGKRRDTSWQPISIADLIGSNYSQLDGLANITTKGFTGHEMVDALGIIHMNGRIYDANLGRFLQADPFIDGVEDTQGYNRYSYVKGNPLTLTDPTGFYSWGDFVDDVKGGLKKLCGSYCGVNVGSNGDVNFWGGQYNPDHNTNGFWAQPGTGGASTPEGSVSGAFGSRAEYLAYIQGYVTKSNRANGGIDPLLSREVDEYISKAFSKHGFDDESAYSLVDAGGESGLSLSAAQNLASSNDEQEAGYWSDHWNDLRDGLSNFFNSEGVIQLGFMSGSLNGCGIVYCMEASGTYGISIDLNDIFDSKAYLQVSFAYGVGIGVGGSATRGLSFGKSPNQLASGFYGSSNHTAFGFASFPFDTGGSAGSYAVDYSDGALSAGGFLGAGVGIGAGAAVGERGSLNIVSSSIKDAVLFGR